MVIDSWSVLSVSISWLTHLGVFTIWFSVHWLGITSINSSIMNSLSNGCTYIWSSNLLGVWESIKWALSQLLSPELIFLIILGVESGSWGIWESL